MLWQVVRSVTTVAKLVGGCMPALMRMRMMRSGTCCGGKGAGGGVAGSGAEQRRPRRRGVRQQVWWRLLRTKQQQPTTMPAPLLSGGGGGGWVLRAAPMPQRSLSYWQGRWALAPTPPYPTTTSTHVHPNTIHRPTHPTHTHLHQRVHRHHQVWLVQVKRLADALPRDGCGHRAAGGVHDARLRGGGGGGRGGRAGAAAGGVGVWGAVAHVQAPTHPGLCPACPPCFSHVTPPLFRTCQALKAARHRKPYLTRKE